MATNTLSSLLIRNARVIDPASHTDRTQDVLLHNGRITQMGHNLAAADNNIDANGLWLLPGLVDIGSPCMPINSIGREVRAAAKGGVTQLAVYSSDDCLLDSSAMLRHLQAESSHQLGAKLVPIAALTQGLEGKQLANMQQLTQLGAAALSNAQQPITSNKVLKRCLEYAATFDLLVTFCPSDPSLAEGGCAHEGAVASRLGLPAIPVSAETLALSRALLLAEESGARLHIHQLSAAASLDLIGNAKQRGVKVTCDVSIHHLLADESAIASFDGNAHILPPLRSASDREALVAAVADGRIDAISSQHTPLSPASKQQPFSSCAAGISGVESLLPLTLKLVNDGKLPLERTLDAVTAAPARCLGLDAGALVEGEIANLCLLDTQEQRLLADGWLSGGANSPWLEEKLAGVVRLSVCDGNVVWEQGA